MSDINKEKNINSEGEKKAGSQIFAIAIVALIIIVIASVFIGNKIYEDSKKEEQAKAIEDNISEKLDKNQQEAANIKEKLNKAIIGTYKSVGYSNEVTTEFHDDGTLTVVTNGTKGWWSSMNKEGTDVVGIIYEEGETPDIYQVYGSRLIDTQSMYYGDVKVGEMMDTTLTMGNLKLKLTKDGKVSGRYDETVVEDGVEYPYSEAYGGNYTVDGEFMELYLNGDVAKFLIIDNEDENVADGVASLYYEKIS